MNENVFKQKFDQIKGLVGEGMSDVQLAKVAEAVLYEMSKEANIPYSVWTYLDKLIFGQKQKVH